ncbi:hypothetical protein P4S52_03050 [Vibrio sp. SA48]|uniref:hypothetical protein n=1 Tax=Vibrio sp. S12_S33 TaxID=2720223 RepID=UPI001782E4A2|nr:hypothetical protein [Vibrio sp. S12_S33]MBD1567004.1 hypothetical protein [Vibrio sp. S12_S33]
MNSIIPIQSHVVFAYTGNSSAAFNHASNTAYGVLKMTEAVGSWEHNIGTR